MFWGDIMTSFGPMCVITSTIARFIPIFKLEYFWNAKTYTGEILIWCHIDGVLSEKPQNTHNLNSLFFNGCLSWKFKNWWNDWAVHYCQVICRVSSTDQIYLRCDKFDRSMTRGKLLDNDTQLFIFITILIMTQLVFTQGTQKTDNSLGAALLGKTQLQPVE